MFSSGVRIHAVVAIGLAAAWIGCSQGDGPSLTKGAPLGKAVQALDPAWTPQSLGPSAWYVASTAPGYAVLSNTHVQQWLDVLVPAITSTRQRKELRVIQLPLDSQ